MKNKFTDFIKSPLFRKILAATAVTATAAAAAAVAAKVVKNRRAALGEMPKGTLPRAKNIYITGDSISALAAAAYLIKDGGYDGSSIHIYGSPKTAPDEEYGSIGNVYYKLMHDIAASTDDGVSVCDIIDNNTFAPEPTVKLLDGSGKVRALDITPDRNTLKAINKALKKLTSGDELSNASISEYFADMREIFDTDLFDFIEMSFGICDTHKASEFVKRAEQVLADAPSTGFYDTLYYDFSTAQALTSYLAANGADLHPVAEVTSIDIDNDRVGAIHLTDDGTRMTIYLNAEDKVIFTAGNIFDNISDGSASETAPLIEEVAPSLPLWAQAATGADGFGIPEILFENVGDSMEFSIVDNDNFLINRICNIIDETPEHGVSLLLTGSNWRMKLTAESICSVAASDEEVYSTASDAADTAGIDVSELTDEDISAAADIAAEPVNSCITVKGMYCSSYGNFVEKPMRECSGTELLYELCGHLGIIEEWENILKNISIIEVTNIPYKTAPMSVVPEHTRPELQACENCFCIGGFMENSAPAATLEQEIVSAKNAAYALMGIKEKKSFFGF